MAVAIQEWVLLIAFLLIYGIFLAYDIFKRSGEEKYGYYAYILAVLPANYLWYIIVKGGLLSFGYTGAMAVLVGLWILLVVRDIFIKDKEKGIKDADDVALMLVISVIVNAIASAVVPEIPDGDFMKQGAQNYWGYFYRPQLNHAALDSLTVLSYRILLTILVFLVLIPILLDLKGTKANIVALIVLTLIFMAPLGYLVFIWSGPSPNVGMMVVWMFLGAIIFFMLLLGITRGKDDQ